MSKNSELTEFKNLLERNSNLRFVYYQIKIEKVRIGEFSLFLRVLNLTLNF